MAQDAENNELPSVDQLDALLEEASALAEDLSLEIAGEDPFQGIADLEAAGDESADDDAGIPTVDEQLDTVNGLLSETQSDLGAESSESLENEALASVDDIPDFMAELASPEQGTSDGAAPDEPAADDSADAIPDFMQEFTESPADESAGGVPQPDSPSTSIDDIPDFMADLAGPDTSSAVSQDSPTSVAVDASPKLGRVGTSFEDVATEAASETEAVSSARSILSKIPKWIPIHLVTKIPVAKVRDLALALTIKVVEKCVDLLEVVDRPTTKIGYKPRQLIGLIAISTLGTALVVFVISMF